MSIIMKTSILFSFLLIGLCGCNSPKLVYEQLYDAEELSDPYGESGITINNEEFSLYIHESAPGQKSIHGVDGTDGENHSHEYKGMTLLYIVESLLRQTTSGNIAFRNVPDLPKLDFYFESHYSKKMRETPFWQQLDGLVGLLSQLFSFTVTFEDVDTPVYGFSIGDNTVIADYFVELDPDRYVVASGFLFVGQDDDGNPKLSNFNNERTEAYRTFEQMLQGVKNCSRAFQYESNVDLDGALVIPYEFFFDKSDEQILEEFLNLCKQWGVVVTSEIRSIETKVVTFGG